MGGRSDPYYPYYYLYLGQCYIHLGDLEKVLDNLYKVLVCEGNVYVTSESFVTSVRDMIRDVENILSSVSHENKRGTRTTTKSITNTKKNNVKKRNKKK